MHGVLRINSVKVSALEAKYQARKAQPKGPAHDADFPDFHEKSARGSSRARKITLGSCADAQSQKSTLCSLTFNYLSDSQSGWLKSDTAARVIWRRIGRNFLGRRAVFAWIFVISDHS